MRYSIEPRERRYVKGYGVVLNGDIWRATGSDFFKF